MDDEEPIRIALRRLLNSAGLDVKAFPSGSDFIESLETSRPDCVVLDVHMPAMSGIEVQAQLRKSWPHVPVIVITGHDSPETRERALAGCPVAYLRKPVNDQDLLDAIQQALVHRSQPESREDLEP